MKAKGRRHPAKYYLLAGIVAVGFYSYSVSPRSLPFGGSPTTVFENSRVRVDQIGSIARLAVAFTLRGDSYATEDHYVFRLRAGSGRFLELGHFESQVSGVAPSLRDRIGRLRIARDIRRNFGANNCVVLQSGTILIFYDKIYRSVDQGKSFRVAMDFAALGIYQPFEHGIAVDRNDDVFFGEYNSHERPHTIRILRGAKDGTEWTVFYQFPPGEIFHVHSIQYDPFRDVLWVCSGDRDQESRLSYIDAQRKNVRVVGSGDQGWRIVSLIPTREALYWCSDNDLIGSSIYRYDFASQKRQELRFIGKPSYYATRLIDGTLVFSTTYEPQSPYSVAFQPEPTADLWISRTGAEWHRVLAMETAKDKTEYTSRPTLMLPSGDYSSSLLFLTPLGTTSSEFHTQALQITWKP